MAKLKLVGIAGSRVVEVSPRSAIDLSSESSDPARCQSFAIVSSLKVRLQKAGVSEEALWDYMLLSHHVSSRKDLTERDWVVIAAQLSAAEQDSVLFGVLVDAIKSEVGTCRVYRVDWEGKFHKVYDGVVPDDILERCQRHADATGCVVQLHNADGEQGVSFFEPASYAVDPSCPPIGDFDPDKPARVFELHKTGHETKYVEIAFPDCPHLEPWGQRHANESGYEVRITDRLGHYTLLSFCPKPPVVIGVNEVSIDEVVWLLLNQWDDQWHWVKLDRTMERFISTASDKESAVAALVEYVSE